MKSTAAITPARCYSVSTVCCDDVASVCERTAGVRTHLVLNLDISDQRCWAGGSGQNGCCQRGCSSGCWGERRWKLSFLHPLVWVQRHQQHDSWTAHPAHPCCPRQDTTGSIMFNKSSLHSVSIVCLSSLFLCLQLLCAFYPCMDHKQYPFSL